MKFQSGFVLTCALLATAAGVVSAPRAHADPHESFAANLLAQNGGQDNNAVSPSAAQSQSFGLGEQRIAVVLRFAVELQPQTQPMPDTSALSRQACPLTSTVPTSPTAATPSTTVTVDTKTIDILDTISAEMQKRLSKKMSVMVDPDTSAIPEGALVIGGCITNANGGNAAKRLIGMNVGASRLGVHVVALSKTKNGWSPVDSFDMQVKGGDILPPLGAAGLAMNAAKDLHQNLSADAKKLSDHIVKKLSKDMHGREEVTKI
jgi:hypothetical protein